MEFDDIKKIWDSQNNEYMYAINEQALHNRILAKKNKATHITNVSELLLMIVNLGAGFIVLLLNVTNNSPSYSLYAMAIWMLISGIYTLVGRLKRLKGTASFERSVLGDLQYAVSVAQYQVRLSQINRWNVLPIAVLCVAAMLENGKPLWISLAVIGFFLVTHFASRWEHGIYESRKHELEELQNRLIMQE